MPLDTAPALHTVPVLHLQPWPRRRPASAAESVYRTCTSLPASCSGTGGFRSRNCGHKPSHSDLSFCSSRPAYLLSPSAMKLPPCQARIMHRARASTRHDECRDPIYCATALQADPAHIIAVIDLHCTPLVFRLLFHCNGSATAQGSPASGWDLGVWADADCSYCRIEPCGMCADK